ncbi:hypothetical protein Q765_02305 [Flavobacterium rivuli WB 3.3-2 = DSM 21788]|uniref:Tetratricopeptide repeat protein n=1 Tax=Flavobacterium rivuli WB 3.3-2 = DSM 21788 TaxID=1121895 RepID=A0A0A2MKC3_9FLAO|nr:tetratricopeptide repeat protein [Flavobacterium rivuli]KGO88750.1 hypothetical protein Q765_02305 [Flavobacterium rivuli WB 3.3-2 = DSM 21788]
MKVTYVLAASLLLSLSAFAQKDELKALKKLDDKEKPTPADFTEYGRLLKEVEPKIAAATPEQKAEYYYYKGSYGVIQVMANPANSKAAFETAIADLNQTIEIEKTGKKKYTKEIQEQIFPELKTGAITMAQTAVDQKNYKLAGAFYAAAYKVDPNDGAQLYNAAAMAVNGQDFDSALEYYLQLEKVGFTGEGTNFSAKSKATGQVENFPNKATMDVAVQRGLYTDAKVDKLPSLRGDIVKNIALIYAQKGEVDKAKQAMTNARKANPEDSSLIIAEAELYLKTKDMAKYKELITEAAAKNPNDAVLFYNLGVVSSEADPAGAEEYYKKALTIKPDYFDALVGVGALQLVDEKKIVDEMNKLTTSAKDNARYEVLKKKKDGLYNKALPYFEKAHQLKPDEQYVISVLAGLYQALERTNDYKAMKAKVKA